MHHHFEVAVFIPGKAYFITHGSEAWSGKEMTAKFVYEPCASGTPAKWSLKSPTGQR